MLIPALPFAKNAQAHALFSQQDEAGHTGRPEGEACRKAGRGRLAVRCAAGGKRVSGSFQQDLRTISAERRATEKPDRFRCLSSASSIRLAAFTDISPMGFSTVVSLGYRKLEK